MVFWPILCPVLVALVAFAVPSNRWRPWLVPLGAALHLAIVITILRQPIDMKEHLGEWLIVDPLNSFFLGYISLFYFICSLYMPPYLNLRHDRPNRTFCTCTLLGLAMMSLVTLSHHLGLMWVAMEATTLVTAPSLYFNHNPRSLEATWKYLMICSVGIALALLGSFFLAYSSLYAGLDTTLLFDKLVEEAPHLELRWLNAAFVLLFVGYGTKMGLAPMHTWKPDAYGEAPGIIGAIMAGGMTSCAFLAILRFYQIASVAHDTQNVQQIMIFIGLLSMAVGAIFMVRQRDIKRLLAYSSIEHMGILVFGIGVGGSAILGSLLHVLHNGLTKGVLFLAVGNIHRAYGSKQAGDLKGLLRRVPFSGAMLLAGFIAITGSPPFGPFVSEFQIVTATFANGRFWSGGLFLLIMLFVFIAMGSTVVSMVLGKPPETKPDTEFRETVGLCLPIAISMALVLLLGLYNPDELITYLENAKAFLSTVR